MWAVKDAADPSLLIGAGEDAADLLGHPAFSRTGHLVVVDACGCPVGMISGTDVQRTIRAAHLRRNGRTNGVLTPGDQKGGRSVTRCSR